MTPEILVDRDNELASMPCLDNIGEPAGILLNGWFKNNPAEWPPHPNLLPIYLGFHIRLFQAPTLISEAALEHYRKYAPIGCRDHYTRSLLRSRGVDAFLSNCLSLLFPRRIEDPESQTAVFVVSRDDRIRSFIPETVGPFEFVGHYSGCTDFAENLRLASGLIDIYRLRAKVIITTMLHCALPAIAMGIPVVVFYPPNSGIQHRSDRERFSSLERMVRVFHLSEARHVDWRGYVVDVSRDKIALLDAFLSLARRWRVQRALPLGPFASPETLPPPTLQDIERYMSSAKKPF